MEKNKTNFLAKIGYFLESLANERTLKNKKK